MDRSLPHAGYGLSCSSLLYAQSVRAGSGLLGLLGRAASGALGTTVSATGTTVSATGAPGTRPPGTPTAEPVHGARQARLSLNSRKRQLSVDNLLAAGTRRGRRAECGPELPGSGHAVLEHACSCLSFCI